MSSFFFSRKGESSEIFDQIHLLQFFFQRIEIHVLGWDGHLCCLLKVRHLQKGRVHLLQESSHPQKFLEGMETCNSTLLKRRQIHCSFAYSFDEETFYVHGYCWMMGSSVGSSMERMFKCLRNRTQFKNSSLAKNITLLANCNVYFHQNS